MEKLVEVVRQLSAARDLARIMYIVRRSARELTGADGATFVLRDHGFCHYADEDAITPLWKGRRFPMEACISGWSMQHRKPAVIEDVAADARIAVDARAPRVKSLVTVPIRAEDPVGAIEAYWATRHRASDVEVKLLCALADSASIAMENVALYTDLTQAIHEADIARESVERASRLKNAFLAMISHELRTPIAALSLQLENLSDHLVDAEDYEAALNLVGGIRVSADRLRTVVETLLEQARVEAGRLSLELARVDPAQAAYEAVGALRERAHAKHLDVQVEVEPVPSVVTDARLLQVALHHLVDNAVKFTHEGTVRVRVTSQNDRVAFAVSDTGPGISPIDRIRVFEPFEQLEPVRYKHHSGVGLGLALVRSIATALGGSVELESKVGVGSTFTLFLPSMSR